MKKIIKILFIIVVLMMLFITISYGSELSVDKLTGNQAGLDRLKITGNHVVSVIAEIGVVISVIVLAILGIKYMLGSVEERAEYKKTLMPYVIGAVLIFGASTIANIVSQFVKAG